MSTTIDVRFHELDPYGHVNHAVYFNYFESARIQLLEEIGYGLDRLRELGFHLLVVEVRARFVAPAVSGDRLSVHTEIVELRRVSSRWTQRLVRGDELLATNDLRAAVTDHAGRPTPPPADMARALRDLVEGTRPVPAG